MLQVSENLGKAHLISLGCARNRVDSEVMLGTLLGKGWIHSPEPEDADVIIVNTCGFIQAAKEESIDTILQACEQKKQNPNLKVVVTGCLTQRYKGQLASGMPEVDFFVGTDEFSKIADYLAAPPAQGTVHAKRTNYLYNENLPRVNTLSPGSAYVKVAEGCQHNCSFCIIPAIRGKLRSRPIDSVVQEVQNLVQHSGIVEINLIAQDLAAFGREKGVDELLPLLKKLVAIEGLQWVRLLYMYPENISDEFLEFFAAEDKLVKYLDIPIQHASNTLLQAMNRNVTQEFLRTLIARVRERVPGIAIRTSMMVGFPGETQEDFEQLKAFVTDMKIDHLGCFTYSKEEGTVAGRMENQIDEKTKTKRQKEILKIQAKISAQNLKQYPGQTLPVLISHQDEDDGAFIGRLSTQAPEVDGVVYIEKISPRHGLPTLGKIYDVKITSAEEYDLFGKL